MHTKPHSALGGVTTHTPIHRIVRHTQTSKQKLEKSRSKASKLTEKEMITVELFFCIQLNKNKETILSYCSIKQQRTTTLHYKHAEQKAELTQCK